MKYLFVADDNEENKPYVSVVEGDTWIEAYCEWSDRDRGQILAEIMMKNVYYRTRP